MLGKGCMDLRAQSPILTSPLPVVPRLCSKRPCSAGPHQDQHLLRWPLGTFLSLHAPPGLDDEPHFLSQAPLKQTWRWGCRCGHLTRSAVGSAEVRRERQEDKTGALARGRRDRRPGLWGTAAPTPGLPPPRGPLPRPTNTLAEGHSWRELLGTSSRPHPQLRKGDCPTAPRDEPRSTGRCEACSPPLLGSPC